MQFFNIKSFKGTAPKLSPRLLPDGVATVAENCKTDKGTLRPVNGSTTVNTPSKAGTKKTIYLYNSLYWLHWLEEVDVVRGPIAGDTTGRLYWTGEGAPKVSNASLITSGGGTGYPNVSYTLGIPAPSAMPSAAVVGASQDPTQAESRSYVYTYVSAWGEEGPPSAPSMIVAVEPTQSVNLTGLAAPPAGSYNIAFKRIYRTATGPSGTAFMFVADIPVANTTHSDTKATKNLGEAIPSTQWDPPPADLHSLKLHPSGFMVGISGRDICFSERYLPHAWPQSYRVPIDHLPVGLGIFGTSVLVLTDSQPYAITGTEPGYMTKERLEVNQACVSRRGIVDVGNGVAYPSPDGLFLIGQGVAKNLTEDTFTRDQWQALTPSSMIGAYYEGCYYGFSGGKGIVLDFVDAKTITVSPTAAYVDAVTDKLYLQVGSNIVAWDDNAGSPQQMKWVSGIKVMNGPVSSPGVAQVRAAGYPVTFKLYADGVLKHNGTIASNAPFRLAGGYRAEEYQIEMSSSYELHSVAATSTMDEMREASHS